MPDSFMRGPDNEELISLDRGKTWHDPRMLRFRLEAAEKRADDMSHKGCPCHNDPLCIESPRNMWKRYYDTEKRNAELEADLARSHEAIQDELNCRKQRDGLHVNEYVLEEALSPDPSWLAEQKAKVWDEDAEWHKLCAPRYQGRYAHVVSERFSRDKAAVLREAGKGK